MEKISFDFNRAGARTVGTRAVSGVVGSGNLEVIVEDHDTLDTHFTIQTSVASYQSLWKVVIEAFVHEYKPIGLRFTLNDNGATPPVVSLRLRQAMEAFTGYKHPQGHYLELGARERIHALMDEGSFVEWLAQEKDYSPHLAVLNLPAEADDGIVIGEAFLQQKAVLVAAQQKDFMGGAVGEIHGAKLTGLFKAAVKARIEVVIVLIDSGGVRLQEANAGEIAISETIRAIFEARNQGIMTIGVVCGKNGAFGGMGIISACLDYIIMSEVGRSGVSGPDVIQAVKGIEAFDAEDRALVWRVYGGKTRYMQSIASCYVGPEVRAIKDAIVQAFNKKRPIELGDVKHHHDVLKNRLQKTVGCEEEGQYLKKIAPQCSESLFEMDTRAFLQAVKVIKDEAS